MSTINLIIFLLFLLCFFIIGFPLLSLFLADYNRKVEEREMLKLETPYKINDDLISDSKLILYKALMKVAEIENLLVVNNVSLKDLISVKENVKFIYRIDYEKELESKTVDFVLFEREEMKPVLIVNITEENTNRKRSKEEEKLEKMFEDVGLSYLKIPKQNKYDLMELREKIVGLKNKENVM